MNKKPIGILDAGIEGLCLLESLVKNFPNNPFIYINDYTNYPYEGKETKEILQYVTSNTNELINRGCELIIVVSNSIIEYCSEYLESLKIKVLKISDLIIDYVNSHYEHKNILLIAKSYIIKSAMYNKNFKYNRLYNAISDPLDDLIKAKNVKTAQSFYKMQDALKLGLGKEVDVICYVDSYISCLNIEMKEYFPHTPTIDLAVVIKNAIIENKAEIYEKKKETPIIIGRYSKSEFSDLSYFINIKYKFIELEKVILKDDKEELERLKKKALKLDLNKENKE